MSTKGNNDQRGFMTRAIHHGYDPADHFGAVAPPVYFTSTYAFETVEGTDAAVAQGGRVYAREHNPTTEVLERRLANLEGAESGIAVASGMAAVGTLILTLLSQGDEIIVHRTLYSNTLAMLRDGLPRFGIKVVPVDLSVPENLDAHLTPRTKLVYFETPINPTSDVLDISAIAARAHAAKVQVVVDSTFASPALQRPLELGADLVLHSLTKYINGHGDMLGGAVLGPAETIERLRGQGLRFITGATLSPMAANLVLRGLKTLAIRMERHSTSALAIARMLEQHPDVAWVRYPFLPSHPGYDIARRQMSAGSGMMAFGLRSGYDGARRMMGKLNIILRGVSLGDTDSLIMHPASMTEARKRINPGAQSTPGVDGDLIRFSVGLEDTEDLVADLQQALEFR